MNLTAQLRESRSKHTLKSYADAVKQLHVFREVLPITTRNSESSAPTPKKQVSTQAPPDHLNRPPVSASPQISH